MNNVPREKSFYWPSDHAYNRAEQRNIDWEYVAETLAQGEIKRCHKEDCKLFVHDFYGLDTPIGVIADIQTGEILTVEWRYKDG